MSDDNVINAAQEGGGKFRDGLQRAWNLYAEMSAYLGSIVKGRSDGDEEPLGTINLVLATMFARGHLLIEDYPGTGKSYLMMSLAKMIRNDLDEDSLNFQTYRRIQCVPDLLPSDITGWTILVGERSVFRPGPVFAYLVLLDEVNRTTPKVQAAMLEAMAEKQVSVEGKTYPLGKLFFVVATQNPLDSAGTFPLPAAQLDRFLFKRRLKAVKTRFLEEILLLQHPEGHKAPDIKLSDLIHAVEVIARIKTNGIERTLVTVAEVIKEWSEEHGKKGLLRPESMPSPRSLQALIRALKAIAFIQGSGDPDKMLVCSRHIEMVACDFFRHRLYPADDSLTEHDRERIIVKIVNEAVSRERSNASRG